jgi:Zn-dependent protease
MNEKALYDGLLNFVCFIMIVTFHEFGHAWTAWKLGDDTAYHQGRVTLNPLAHIDFFGTIVLPILAVLMAASGPGMGGLLIGWGRPVQVNRSRLKHRRRDDTLITFAGPAMNIVLALLVLLVARIAGGAFGGQVTQFAVKLAELSIFLFYFNLVPVPPLDGGHILRNAVGMAEETFMRLYQYGFIAILVLINIPYFNALLEFLTLVTFRLCWHLFGF